MKKAIIILLISTLLVQYCFGELIRDKATEVNIDSYKAGNNQVVFALMVDVNDNNELGKVRLKMRYKTRESEWEYTDNIDMSKMFVKSGFYEVVWYYTEDIDENNLTDVEVEFDAYTYDIPENIEKPVVYVVEEAYPSGVKINGQEEYAVLEKGKQKVTIGREGYSSVKKEITGKEGDIYFLKTKLIPDKPSKRYSNTAMNTWYCGLGVSVIIALLLGDNWDEENHYQTTGIIAIGFLLGYLIVRIYEAVKYGEEDVKIAKRRKEWENKYKDKESFIEIISIE